MMADSYQPRPIPAPTPNCETQEFWTAAQDGRLLLRHCESCGRSHWYPRAVCPFCDSTSTSWRQASGRGVIYTFSVMRRAKIPFACAYVTLDEGPTMLTNIVDCDFGGLRIGAAVQAAFVPAQESGQMVPVFRLCSGSE